MSRESAPCKDCTDRVLGCHSECERYIEYKRLREEINTARYQALRELNKPYITRYKNPWKA